MGNWYVIQVRGGLEEKTLATCKMLISDEILLDGFIPKVKHLRKKEQKWMEIEEVLFTGYVFLVSDRINDLYYALKKVPDLTKLLGKYAYDIYPLNDEEIAFLKTFGKEEHVIDVSTGYIENDYVHVTSGPLKGHEGYIKRIDRHKRMAYLEIEFFGKTSKVKVGLEVISKNTERK